MALLFTLLCGGAVLVLAYFGYYFSRGHIIHGAEAVIDAEIKYITSLDNPQSVKSSDDRVYESFTGIDLPPAIISESISSLSEGMIVFDNASNHKKYAAKIHTFNDGKKVLVGVDITQVEKDLSYLRWLSFICIGLMGIVILISYAISFFVVGGTNQIANTAQDIINTGDLTRRIEVNSSWDDLSKMTVVLNTLLERIEQLMLETRRVSDNIAHDLRTPLTRMKNQIEDLQKEADNPIYDQLTQEADQLISTFNALLKISRIESEQQRSQFTKVELDKILNDVITFYEPLAEEKNINLSAEFIEVKLNGDRRLLFQAFANLLDNAIKFTPPGGCIKLGLQQTDNQVSFWISDNGPGIPAYEKEKVFHRFYRSESSRSSSGTGLGLSLVLTVVNLHEGNIRLSDSKTGLKVTIELPG
ncbi:MAG: sensor histidine kinase [Gammaproteobacteria bacterium]